jgi:hypothetical protein
MIDNIKIFENFLSKEQCQIFVNEANNAEVEKWTKNNFYHTLKSSNHEEVKNIKRKLDEVFENKFHIQRPQVIHRTDSSSKWTYHSDDEGGKEIKYGIVIYLNDEFEGGHTKYKNKEYELVPKPGMMILHPANKEFEHTVTDVTKGIRYTLTSFAREIN